MAFLSDISPIINIVILSFLIVTALAVIKSRNLITAVVMLSIFSMLMSAQYLILGAPDVAITEAAVGAGISTILFLTCIFMVSEKESKAGRKKLFPFIIVALVAAMLIFASGSLPPFGDANTFAQTHVAEYYIQNSYADTGINNIVTSVLASYRGYDTFGEIIVIFTAGIAVLMLLGRRI